MKAKKIYKALLENVPSVMGKMEIDDFRRETIAIIQIQALLPLLGNKKKNQKWLCKEMMKSGVFINQLSSYAHSS